MNEAVLDASVILKWFATEPEELLSEAQALRRRYAAADLGVIVPSILFLEILNVAGRRWHWGEAELLDLASDIEALELEVGSADPSSIASWTSRGLSSYDAAYVALAETLDIPLVTNDSRVVSIAGPLATPLAEAR